MAYPFNTASVGVWLISTFRDLLKQMTRFPITIDISLQLMLTALYCRGVNFHYGINLRTFLYSHHPVGPTNQDGEKPEVALTKDSISFSSRHRVIATAVGWREDPVWYKKCLRSLAKNRNCELLIAGIDGNETEDEEMVDIFKLVCLIPCEHCLLCSASACLA